MSSIDRKVSGSRTPGLAPVLLIVGVMLLLTAPLAAEAANADHLIISEVMTLSNVDDDRRPLCSEFIEIVNPTGAAIDMSRVFLSDGTYAPGETFYWRIAEDGVTVGQVGGGTFSDFHGRFPDGYSIAAGDTIVVSVTGSEEYFAAYGKLPDFELYEDGAMPDTVPELAEAMPGSINAGLSGGGNSPRLTESSESLILYLWDGTSDLVVDLDFMFWGTSSSILFDKSGITVGSSTYASDTAPISQVGVSDEEIIFGESYMRSSADEVDEPQSGGNGFGGHDETGENMELSWDTATVQDPADAPGSWHPTAPIITEVSFDPLAPSDGQEVTLSVSAVSNSLLTGVTFFYQVGEGSFVQVTGTSVGGGSYTATVPAQSEGTQVRWYALATNADNISTVHPVGGEDFATGWTVAGEPQPTDDPDKLLLTEICTLGSAQEFIEIYNPNPYPVVMSDYYLTDAIHTSNEYWKVTQPDPQNFVGGGTFNDFYARFPNGFSIAAGDTIVVSIPGSTSFEESFGFLPELELYEDGGTADSVLDMVPLWGSGASSSIRGDGSDPTLTNGGEVVILLYWDGDSDLITDIDMFNWKDPGYTSTSFLFSKTGETVGSSTYGPDTPTSQQTPFDVQLDFGNSYQRKSASEGSQSLTGLGNGVGGGDETSEDFNNTFEMLPFDPSLPSVTNPLAPLVGSPTISPAKPAAGQDVTLQVTMTSETPITEVDFFYSSSGGGFTPLPGIDAGNGVYRAVMPGQDFGVEVAWYCAATNEGGFTTVFPLTAPGGALGFIVGADPFGLVIEAKTFMPTQGEIFTVRFNSKPGSETRLRIFDLEGRLVHTLFDSRFGGEVSVQPGKFDRITWDGRDSNFELVKAGAYIVHLSVVNSLTGEEDFTTAPVVVATRLSN